MQLSTKYCLTKSGKSSLQPYLGGKKNYQQLSDYVSHASQGIFIQYIVLYNYNYSIILITSDTMQYKKGVLNLCYSKSYSLFLVVILGTVTCSKNGCLILYRLEIYFCPKQLNVTVSAGEKKNCFNVFFFFVLVRNMAADILISCRGVRAFLLRPVKTP